MWFDSPLSGISLSVSCTLTELNWPCFCAGELLFFCEGNERFSDYCWTSWGERVILYFDFCVNSASRVRSQHIIFFSRSSRLQVWFNLSYSSFLAPTMQWLSLCQWELGGLTFLSINQNCQSYLPMSVSWFSNINAGGKQRCEASEFWEGANLIY